MDSYLASNGLEMENKFRDLYVDLTNHKAMWDCVTEILSDFKSLFFFIRILNCEVLKDLD